MTSPGWLTRSLADVPTDDGWLGVCEVEVLAGLRFEKRRADWRLGRFASKAAVAIWLGVPPGRVEVAAAPDGAPEAWLDGRRAPASLSLNDWLAPSERRLPAAAGARRDNVANLLWTAKEAAAARREGLRLDVRQAVAELEGLSSTTPDWRRLAVVWGDGAGRAAGWWRAGARAAASARRLNSGRRPRRGGRVLEQALKLVAFEFHGSFRVKAPGPRP